MASVAALNVRIGGDIKALEKALKDAERAVRTAGTRLSAIGNELSMKLTLPILAFGAAAIKSAGEIEAIEKAMQATFQGAGRSIEEANAELVALRKAAEAPGLDFEQAVKASLRLQGVGFSAEKARNTIIQLANAISTTGGTAENLNGVTVQFAQIISKGKILTSDLNVIKENMPGLAKIMKETFGTTSAEDLRALGVNGQEFVEKITAAMQKLPRVEGGISNAIVNAGVAIKMFLANVGESLNKTFNVTGKLEAFSSFLSGIGEKFSNMSEGTQRAITAVGVFALALGPMLKVGQFAVLAIGQMIAVFGALQKVLLQSLAGQAIPGAIAAFKALDVATKLTIVGAAIGVVLALAAAFTVLRKDTSDAAKAQEQLGIVETMASNSVAEQMTRVNILTSTLKSNTASLDAKKRALSDLNKIAPEYFGKVKMGADVVNQATIAQNAYRESLMKTARVQAATEQLVALEKELNSLAQNSSATMFQTLSNAISSGGSATKFFSEQAQTLGDNFEKSKTTIEAQKKVLLDLITTNQGVAVGTKNTTDKYKDNSDAVADATKKTKIYAEALADVKKVTDSANLTGSDGFDAQADAIQSGLNKLLDAGYSPESKQVKGFVDMMKALRDSTSMGSLAPLSGSEPSAPSSQKTGGDMEDSLLVQQFKTAASAIENYTDKLEEARLKSEEFLSGVPDKFAIAAEGITAFGEIVSASLEKGADGWKSFAQEAISAIGDLIGALIKLAVANAVASAIKQGSKINPLVGIALAGVAGALAAAVFKKAVNAAVFADGGIVSGPTHALVGEYPGASNNPEVIAPLNKLKGMLRGTGGDVNVSGTFRVQGTDLLLVLEKAQKSRGRVAGY